MERRSVAMWSGGGKTAYLARLPAVLNGTDTPTSSNRMKGLPADPSLGLTVSVAAIAICQESHRRDFKGETG
jgi:hypothetical protein